MTITNLPFDLSVESTTDWLQSLSQLNSTHSANKLNKVLQQLRKTSTKNDNVFLILLQLTPTILYITHTLESSIVAEADITGHTKSRKVGKLCIQLLRNLSLAFCNFTNKETISNEERNQAIYFSLHLIGYTQRITTVFHQFPSSRLWKTTGEIFTLAQNRNIVNNEINHKIREFKNLHSIDLVIKRNLLFSILAPYQYTSNEIKELFVLSEQNAHLLELNPPNSTENNFYWNSKNGSPPCLNNELFKNNNANINTTSLISFLHSNSYIPNNVLKDILARIVEQLSGFKTLINTATVSELNICHLIAGYTEILDYLEKTGTRDKIQQLSLLLDNTAVNNISIEPMEFEKNYLNPHFNPTPSNSQTELPKTAQAVKILPTSDKQYLIATINTIVCSLDDIVLLYYSNVNTELAIIRQIKKDRTSNCTNILLEKISGTPSYHLILAPETAGKQAILVQEDNSKTELILPPCKLYNGTEIKLASDDTITLEKLTDHNPHFMRYLLN